MKAAWSQLALTDREAIFDYAESRSSRMAIVGDERISMAVRRLAAFPELGHVGRVEGTRELGVEGTPFIVVYRLTERRGDAALTILRVLHGARRWPRAASRAPLAAQDRIALVAWAPPHCPR